MDDYIFTYVNRELNEVIKTKTIETIEYTNVDGSGDESVEVKFTDGSTLRLMAGNCEPPNYKFQLGSMYTEPDGVHWKFYPGYEECVGKS